MSNTDFDLENIIPGTEANLRDEQKQAMAKAMEDYKQLCLKSFSINRSGEVIQKEALSAPRQITFEANPGKLQDMVDSAVNRALINQSGVLSNTVFNTVARTFKEGQLPPNYVGPAYHQLGSSLVTAPSATTAVAGTEATCRCFPPGGSHQRVKLVCVLPFPDGDARKDTKIYPGSGKRRPYVQRGGVFVLSCT